MASIKSGNPYVVPERLELYILPAGSDSALLWRIQAILVMADIFEVLDNLNIHISNDLTQQVKGLAYQKPCLVLHRLSESESSTTFIPSRMNVGSSLSSVEVECDITKIICEHFYKYYIFTHQTEPRSQRIARPVQVEGDSEPALVIQPKNCNARVRKLRGSRKQYIGIFGMVEHMFTKTSDQLMETLQSAAKSPEMKGDASTVWIPSDIVVIGRKLRLTPYYGGGKITELAATLSNQLEWFDRLQETPEWRHAIHLEQGFCRKHELAQYKIESRIDLIAHVPGQVSLKEFKSLQEHVRGPRCDWVTDRKRNHHLVRTSYDNLLIKLQEASIVVPDDTLRSLDKLDLGLSDFHWIPWTSLPSQLDPAFGCLKPERAERKRQQICNIIHYASRILQDGEHVVDFCGGGGHISLVLAWLFPRIQVTLLDRNEVSLAIAHRRKQELGLQNLDIVCSDVQLWIPTSPFQLGVAIHACGSLSDIIMEQCIKQGSSYLMAPCCFGSLQNCDTSVIRLPRSQRFADAGITIEDYLSLASEADINTSGVTLESQQYKAGKKAMGIIDHDRNLRAIQDGYQTFQFTMRPPTCTPKNEIICGISQNSIETIYENCSPKSREVVSKEVSSLIFEEKNTRLTLNTPQN